MEEIFYSNYYVKLASAYARGVEIRTGNYKLCPKEILDKNLDEMREEESVILLDNCRKENIKLYPFKSMHDELPRVKKVIGFLKSITFESLLDVGSGRGVFLFPFLNDFSWVETTSLDILENRVVFLNDLKLWVISNLTPILADICSAEIPNKSVDVVTMLEVLEHIPDVKKAILSAVKIAKKYIIITVPSKPDDNPEHIRLLTKEWLENYFYELGYEKLKFDAVSGHTVLIVTL